MPSIDVVVETRVSRSARARQLEGMFDCPVGEKARLQWKIEAPIESRPWSVGLIVGPSGSGKSTVARHLFGAKLDDAPVWDGPSVVDDFDSALKMADISKVCQAVGFNTVPAWLRPYAVLSNGEKFRVDLARRLIESDGLSVVDEFTSVVDRQVAQIGSHAVQKYVRRQKQKFVAVACHYDIEEWLQPDWVIEPATETFRWRLVQPRPQLDVQIAPVPRTAWSLFAPYHYMSAQLNPSAKCFGLWCRGQLAAFAAILPRPVSNGRAKGEAIRAVSRVVTLPDFQGVGLAFVLLNKIGALYKALGVRFRNYPMHPAFVRAHRKPTWVLVKRPGRVRAASRNIGFGDRACATFEYRGPAHPNRQEAQRILAFKAT